MNLFCKLFYYLKPLVPRQLQLFFRRTLLHRKLPEVSHIWPIDPDAGNPPESWTGWPDGKQFAVILTHDVETERGLRRVKDLAELEMSMGFRSSFNFVPERYNVPIELREYLVKNGFEVGVHGLKHDGKLYSSEKMFKKRAEKINYYLKEWNVVGFRSPAMHHNLDWLHHLNIDYDLSTFDTDPFEPQSDGAKTIFPFWVENPCGDGGFVEMPYTLPQDFTLFILMKEKTIDFWKRKLEWIAKHGGVALVNVHPDYMNFEDRKAGIEEYPLEQYKNFLKFLIKEYQNLFWHTLPNQLFSFWRDFSRTK